MVIGYIAVETIITTEKYRNWCKLFHVKEVVSLDCALCPSILDYKKIEDKKNLFNSYYYWSGYGDIVNNLNYLLNKVNGLKDVQILAVIAEPDGDCRNLFFDNRFKFYGYDLLEDGTRVSALNNCGGFDKVFLPEDISENGLIIEFNKARKIQKLLVYEYPDEPHAYCTLWAIWRMETGF